jgi:hypothetical protein
VRRDLQRPLGRAEFPGDLGPRPRRRSAVEHRLQQRPQRPAAGRVLVVGGEAFRLSAGVGGRWGTVGSILVLGYPSEWCVEATPRGRELVDPRRRLV